MTKSDAKIVAKQVEAEAGRARDKYGDFTSTHEGYGVLAEEVAELLEAIRSNRRFAIQAEAIQVSAVALRLAQQLEHGAVGFLDRSGIRMTQA